MGLPLYLELFVRVTPRWKDMPRQLNELGYEGDAARALSSVLPEIKRPKTPVRKRPTSKNATNKRATNKNATSKNATNKRALPGKPATKPSTTSASRGKSSGRKAAPQRKKTAPRTPRGLR
jgi:hypothetical protein